MRRPHRGHEHGTTPRVGRQRRPPGARRPGEEVRYRRVERRRGRPPLRHRVRSNGRGSDYVRGRVGRGSPIFTDTTASSRCPPPPRRGIKGAHPRDPQATGGTFSWPSVSAGGVEPDGVGRRIPRGPTPRIRPPRSIERGHGGDPARRRCVRPKGRPGHRTARRRRVPKWWGDDGDARTTARSGRPEPGVRPSRSAARPGHSGGRAVRGYGRCGRAHGCRRRLGRRPLRRALAPRRGRDRCCSPESRRVRRPTSSGWPLEARTDRYERDGPSCGTGARRQPQASQSG